MGIKKFTFGYIKATPIFYSDMAKNMAKKKIHTLRKLAKCSAERSLSLYQGSVPSQTKRKLPHPVSGEGVGCRGTPLLARCKGLEPLTYWFVVNERS